jgi:hypothetical protein
MRYSLIANLSSYTTSTCCGVGLVCLFVCFSLSLVCVCHMSDKLSRRRSAQPKRSSSVVSRAGSLSRKSSSSSGSTLQLFPDNVPAASGTSNEDVTSEEGDYHICPPQFLAHLIEGDTYIMHSRIVAPSGNMRVFVLTNQAIYKFTADGEYRYVLGRSRLHRHRYFGWFAHYDRQACVALIMLHLLM